MPTRQIPRLLLALLVGLACGPEAEPPPEASSGAEPGAVLSEAPDALEPSAPLSRRRGLWVLCEGSQRVLERPERIPALIDDARALGATDLFVQVYRRGVAWFPSSFAGAAPYSRMGTAAGGDTLEKLLAAAHAAGLRVHAWVNVLALAGNRRAAVLRELGPQAVMVDQRGRSLLDYPNHDVPQPDRRFLRLGTPGIYLDPGSPGVANYLVGTFAELLRLYPDLDGLHLDYIRHPDVLPFTPGSRFGVGLHLGYGEASRERFRQDTGLKAPFGDSLRNANAWDDWRREQVTALVAKIAGASRAEIPDLEVSAAVWAWPDRAYLAVFQDWRGWLLAGHLDFAVPMLYTLDDRLLGYASHAFAGGVAGERIWAGLGAWLFAKTPERVRTQLRIVEESGLSGDALFSWDSIAASPSLRLGLAVEVGDGVP